MKYTEYDDEHLYLIQIESTIYTKTRTIRILGYSYTMGI